MAPPLGAPHWDAPDPHWDAPGNEVHGDEPDGTIFVVGEAVRGVVNRGTDALHGPRSKNRLGQAWLEHVTALQSPTLSTNEHVSRPKAMTLSTTNHMKLGPFRLLESVGIGGMGEVWRAVHERQPVEVAIKVMTAERARDERFQRAFRDEVRAVARLDHPGVIMVFDCGVVERATELATGGRIVAGSSYLAMELASTTLNEIDKSSLDWWQQRALLMRILDALSHSHARGVIHRDLKPANVLFVTTSDGSQELKLSDFGLAHALDDVDMPGLTDAKVSGTPRFMSPEQIMGQWRDQGPWTDLYAVGCLAYWMASGNPPFSGADTDQILRGHLFEDVPSMQTIGPVPQGFQAWVARLLAKRASQRYQRAADAAYDLLNLGPPGDAPSPAARATSASFDDEDKTELLDETLVLPESSWENNLSVAALPAGNPPPIPTNWRSKEAPRRSMELIGVGLGLFGLRQIPLVARQAERDAIWQGLREVHESGMPRVLVLRGSAGTGKSRLAEWMAERAHELGAAQVLKATHSPISGPADGLARMIASFLRCTGLSREQLLERIRQFMGEDGPMSSDDLHDCFALTELLAPSTDPDYDESKVRVRFANPTERHMVFRRLLWRVTQHRPALLNLDDVQWGSDTLGFVQHLLEPHGESRLPLLVVLTVRDEALETRPIAREQLDDLLSHSAATQIGVGALPDEAHATLVQHLLGLEEQLAGQVAARTAGNPLFAVQLVGDWVERGVLEVGKGGFCLRPGESSALPDDIHHLLINRIEKLAGQQIQAPPNDARMALELAAALGQDVETREWEHICRQGGLRVPADLIDSMASSRLAQVGPHGWTFVHGALRESLERLARDGHRWQRHQRACAEMLRQLYGASQRGVSQRLGRHLLQAEEFEDALEPLLLGADEYRVTCNFRHAHALFDLYEDTMRRIGLPQTDRRWVEGWLKRVPTLNRQETFDVSTSLLDRAEALVRANDWPDLLAETLFLRGSTAKMRGEVRQGVALATEAMRLFGELNHRSGLARCTFLVAELSFWAGDMQLSKQSYYDAQRLFAEIGDATEAASCKSGLGSVYTKLDDKEHAVALLEEAIEEFKAIGDSLAVSNALNNLGELYRFGGDFARAQSYYEGALELLERIGIHDDVVVLFNLGLTMLDRGNYGGARHVLQGVLASLITTNRSGYIGIAHASLLPCRAWGKEWERWDHDLEQAAHHLTKSAMVDADVGRIAQLAGDLAAAAKEPQRARKAYELAVDQWRALGEDARVAKVEGRLGRLGAPS